MLMYAWDFVLIQLLRYSFVVSNHYHLFNMLKGCGVACSYKTLFSLSHEGVKMTLDMANLCRYESRRKNQ